MKYLFWALGAAAVGGAVWYIKKEVDEYNAWLEGERNRPGPNDDDGFYGGLIDDYPGTDPSIENADWSGLERVEETPVFVAIPANQYSAAIRNIQRPSGKKKMSGAYPPGGSDYFINPYQNGLVRRWN